jgi:hypothetical protein
MNACAVHDWALADIVSVHCRSPRLGCFETRLSDSFARYNLNLKKLWKENLPIYFHQKETAPTLYWDGETI